MHLDGSTQDTHRPRGLGLDHWRRPVPPLPKSSTAQIWSCASTTLSTSRPLRAAMVSTTTAAIRAAPTAPRTPPAGSRPDAARHRHHHLQHPAVWRASRLHPRLVASVVTTSPRARLSSPDRPPAENVARYPARPAVLRRDHLLRLRRRYRGWRSGLRSPRSKNASWFRTT